MVLYTVQATFTDARVADEWVAWLRDGHLADVLRGGALDAEVVRLDGEALTYEVHYHFASPEAFARYEREFAPALRAEGLAKFPSSRGVSYRRSVGAVVVQAGPH
ncbi:MAG: DUF4286 family protein [Phycisphaerae bacterium]|jgi:hypothetical protein|nr:DUF4286 family protein [Phycisphaerae bacterium]